MRITLQLENHGDTGAGRPGAGLDRRLVCLQRERRLQEKQILIVVKTAEAISVRAPSYWSKNPRSAEAGHVWKAPFPESETGRIDNLINVQCCAVDDHSAQVYIVRLRWQGGVSRGEQAADRPNVANTRSIFDTTTW